jgi:hypothetical protein
MSRWSDYLCGAGAIFGWGTPSEPSADIDDSTSVGIFSSSLLLLLLLLLLLFLLLLLLLLFYRMMPVRVLQSPSARSQASRASLFLPKPTMCMCSNMLCACFKRCARRRRRSMYVRSEEKTHGFEGHGCCAFYSPATPSFTSLHALSHTLNPLFPPRSSGGWSCCFCSGTSAFTKRPRLRVAGTRECIWSALLPYSISEHRTCHSGDWRGRFSILNTRANVFCSHSSTLYQLFYLPLCSCTRESMCECVSMRERESLLVLVGV